MTPQDENEMAEAIRSADGPLRISGGGTRPIGHSCEGQVLSTRGMAKVTLYEPSALTIVAQAGTPLDDIQAALESEGQMLPFEPMDHQAILGVQGAPTIGGAAACNISGPRRIQGIACRDSMIGVRFVDGTGTVLKNGGRVMKNVTGYDLVKLMAGSLGTLGVMTEVALKVLPKPEACGVVLINGLSDTQAIQALSQALGSPFDVSGVAHVPVGVDGHPVTMVRVEGLGRSVTYRSDALAKLLSPFGETLVELDPDRTSSGWKWVRNVTAFDGLEGDIWRLSVKPSDGPDVVAKLAPLRTVYDWGGGLVWVLMPVGSDVRKHLVQGHATLIRGSDETKSARGVFHPEPGPLARISEGLREKFDPRGILNTGIMG